MAIAEHVLTIISVVVGFTTTAAAIFYSKKEKKLKTKISQLKNEHEHELLTSQIEIQEQILQHMARELHDNIGQTLSILKLNWISLAPYLPPSQAEKHKLLDELADKVIHDLRAVTTSLEPQYIQGSFSAKLKRLFNDIEKTRRFNTTLELKGIETELHPEGEIILFRIVQEVLNNTLKHSGATVIKMGLDYTENGLSIILKENGKGFNYDDMIKISNGAGLRNLKKRASLLGGDISFYQIIDNGEKYMTTKIEIPKSSL